MESIEEERGAGGKSKRPNSRRTPTTPYDRPAALPCLNKSNASSKWGWISNSTRRLISTGALRLFPSIFSTSSTHLSLDTPPCKQDQDINQYEEFPFPVSSKHIGLPLPIEVSNTTNIEGVSHEMDTNNMAENKMFDFRDNNKMKKIEQILMKRFFSREEIAHLLEILNSKVIDGSPVCVEKNVRDLNISRSKMEISTSSLSRNPHEEAATPVEIARAYMGSRGLDRGLGPVEKSSRFGKAILFDDDIVSEKSPKSPICWPGAVLNAQSNRLTPQSRNSRFGFYNSPRTPYSRSMYSNHGMQRHNLEYGGSKSADIPSAPSGIDQNLPSSRLLDNSSKGMADRSVGPIRQRLSRIAMEKNSRISSFVPTPRNDLTQVRFKGPLKTNPECVLGRDVQMNTPQEAEASSPTPHTDSSSLARRILEHINRNTPTMKEKSAEIALATGSKDKLGSLDAGDDGYRDHRLEKFKLPNKIEDESSNGTEKPDVSLHSKYMKKGDEDGRVEKDYSASQGWPRPEINKREEAIYGSESKARPYSLLGTKRAVGSIAISTPDCRFSSSFDNSISGFTFPTTTTTSLLSPALLEPPTPSVMPSVLFKQQPEEGEINFKFGRDCKSSSESDPPLVFSFPCAADSPNDSDINFGFGYDEEHNNRMSFNILG